MQQQGVRRNQKNLEEHEQVEQIGSQKRTMDADQLELEQSMKVGSALVIATACVDHCAGRQHCGDQQHQCTQAVEHQDDAERRLPVPQGVDAQLVVTCQHQQPDSDWDQQ